jgi:hypothetical protein
MASLWSPGKAVWNSSLVILLSGLSLFGGGSGGKGSSSAPATVHVNEYTRKDGTVVGAYDRAAPGTAQSSAPAGSSAQTTTSATPSGQAAESATANPVGIAATTLANGSDLALPSWLPPVAGSKVLARNATSTNMMVSYSVPSRAVTVVSDYKSQILNARASFESTFDGLAVSIRASGAEYSCVVRITENGDNSDVTVRCSLREPNMPFVPTGK